MSRRLPAGQAGLPPNPFNSLNDPVNLAMTGRSATIIVIDVIEHLRQVTWARTDVHNRGTNAEDIINLARMHQPHKGVAQDDDMEIRGRQRSGQLVQRLVRQAQDG